MNAESAHCSHRGMAVADATSLRGCFTAALGGAFIAVIASLISVRSIAARGTMQSGDAGQRTEGMARKDGSDREEEDGESEAMDVLLLREESRNSRRAERLKLSFLHWDGTEEALRHTLEAAASS